MSNDCDSQGIRGHGSAIMTRGRDMGLSQGLAIPAEADMLWVRLTQARPQRRRWIATLPRERRK